MAAPIPLHTLPLIKCSTGCSILDSALNGGVPVGAITELVGESGAAKTQLALQMLVAVQMPRHNGGLSGSALYLHTEGYFPARRLKQLAALFVESGRFENAEWDPGGALEGQENSHEFDNSVYGSYFHVLGKKRACESSCHKDSEKRKVRVMAYDKKNICPPVSCPHLPSLDAKVIKKEMENHNLDTQQVLLSNCNKERQKRKITDMVYDKENICPALGLDHLHKDANVVKRATEGCNSENPQVPLWSYMARKRVQNQLKATRLQKPYDPCEHIFIEGLHTIQELFSALDRISMFSKHTGKMPLRLIIIDSVAALFRAEFDNNRSDLMARSEVFFQLSSRLRKYAQQYKLAIVVTNQVTDCFEENEQKKIQVGNFRDLQTSGRRVTPSLGLSWAHCVNMRIFLSRTEQLLDLGSNMVSKNHLFCQIEENDYECINGQLEIYEKKDEDLSRLPISGYLDMVKVKTVDLANQTPNIVLKRTLQVVFAPHLPGTSWDFVVDQKGVRGIPCILDS